ncbi:Serine/threonine protein phosphatase, partial [Dysosmobacter welbionis]
GGGAHLPHEYIRNLTAAQGGGVHRQGIRLPMGVAAQMPQDADGGVHIPQPGAAQQRH